MARIVWRPNDGPQTYFLATPIREVLYGGAAAGGKTDALLACDLRWATHPLHRSLYLRRTRPQLQEAIDRAIYLYPQVIPGIVWQEGKSRFEAPSGALYQFGHAEHEPDIMNFKSFEYNVIKFDELTTFTERQYKFMFMRNRSKSKDLPLWIRSGTNPGDVGHEFVYNRFIKGKEPYTVYNQEIELDSGKKLVVAQQFVPSFVWDNPSLPNADEYIAGLMQMSEEDVAAYLYGQWTKLAGAMFKVMPKEVAPGLKKRDHYTVRCMDYGWADATCVYWLVVYDNGLTVEIVKELYVNQTKIEGIAHLIKEAEGELISQGMNPPSISIGSPEMKKTEGTSGQSLASVFALHGCPVTPSEGAPGSRKFGWTQIQRFLQAERLHYWPGACPNLLRTLPILMRDPNKKEDLKERQEDHAVDALRYGLVSIVEPAGLVNVVPQVEVIKANFDHKYDKLIDQLKRGKRNTSLGQFFS